MPVRKSLREKALVRVAPDLRHRLRGRAGVGLDLRLERNRAVREVLVLERLVRGMAENGAASSSTAATPARTTENMDGSSRGCAISP